MHCVGILTEKIHKLRYQHEKDVVNSILKMRPTGNTTPYHKLKEQWLDEYIESMWPKLEAPKKGEENKIFYRKDPIEFVFDRDPKSIEMWRRRGVFVFDCNQKGEAKNGMS